MQIGSRELANWGTCRRFADVGKLPGWWGCESWKGGKCSHQLHSSLPRNLWHRGTASSVECWQLFWAEQEQVDASVLVMWSLKWVAYFSSTLLPLGRTHKVCPRLVLQAGEEEIQAHPMFLLCKRLPMWWLHQPRKVSTLHSSLAMNLGKCLCPCIVLSTVKQIIFLLITILLTFSIREKNNNLVCSLSSIFVPTFRLHPRLV